MDQPQILTPDPRRRLVSTDPRMRSSQRQPLVFNAPQRSNLRRSNIIQDADALDQNSGNLNFQSQDFVTTASLDDTLRKFESSIESKTASMFNNLQNRDNYLLGEMSKMITASQETTNQRSNPQQPESKYGNKNATYQDLDVDNIAGGEQLQNALRGVNPADYIPGFEIFRLVNH